MKICRRVGKRVRVGKEEGKKENRNSQMTKKRTLEEEEEEESREVRKKMMMEEFKIILKFKGGMKLHQLARSLLQMD